MIKYDFSKLTVPADRLSGIPQNTQVWLDARRGRVTASLRAHKILYSRDSTLDNMMDEMATELNHPAADGFSSAATDHGHAFEDQATNEYDMGRLTFGDLIKAPGMFVHETIDIASATPDFFEGDDTTGQIKCPFKLKNHNKLLHWGIAPQGGHPGHPNYYTQVQFESFITRRPKIVFVSYHPDAPPTNQLYVEYLEADRDMHKRFEEKLNLINHMLVNDERFVKESGETLDGIPDLF